MSAGDIVGLVATRLFAVLVALIGILLFKFGSVLDAIRDAIVDANASLTPLVGEVTETVRSTNTQLAGSTRSPRTWPMSRATSRHSSRCSPRPSAAP